MQVNGQIQKLISDVSGDVVQYALPIGSEKISLNPFIGKRISISFADEITCINCGRKTKKSFAQGHCFPCMRSLARCDTCIVKPELCHHHEGTCREPDWAETNCFTDHFVYLSNTSGLKIGITRGSQLPTRWVDQGAVAALPIYRVKTRRIAGLLEHPAASLIADKTNWRTMLKGNIEPIDIQARWQELKPELDKIATDIRAEFGEDAIITLEEQIQEFNYPVLQYLEKISSHNLDKAKQAAGQLLGIKGQYLILDTGVLNIRKYTGYTLSFDLED